VVLFVQAEDGIRGRNVTGVQTCALPIYAGGGGVGPGGVGDQTDVLPLQRAQLLRFQQVLDAEAEVPTRALVRGSTSTGGTGGGRSEERRVGKECGCGRTVTRSQHSAGTW